MVKVFSSGVRSKPCNISTWLQMFCTQYLPFQRVLKCKVSRIRVQHPTGKGRLLKPLERLSDQGSQMSQNQMAAFITCLCPDLGSIFFYISSKSITKDLNFDVG